MLSINLSGHITEDTMPMSLASAAVNFLPNNRISLKQARLWGMNVCDANASGIWPSLEYVSRQKVALSLANTISK